MDQREFGSKAADELGRERRHDFKARVGGVAVVVAVLGDDEAAGVIDADQVANVWNQKFKVAFPFIDLPGDKTELLKACTAGLGLGDDVF